MFRNWRCGLPKGVTVHPVTFPGHQGRFRQPLISQVLKLVPKIFEELKPQLETPVAFFGHSLGGLIAFEVVREMRRRGEIPPALLLTSGCAAPQLLKARTNFHALPDRSFQRKCASIIPLNVRRNPELMSLMLPILRADVTLFETYQYSEEAPLDCRICAFGGTSDMGVRRPDLNAWKVQTTNSFTLRMFKGDHFFIINREKEILKTMHRELKRVLLQ